jgi:4-amino-4-deoxy-L-arabinose transferase-like glycosyltransferase
METKFYPCASNFPPVNFGKGDSSKRSDILELEPYPPSESVFSGTEIRYQWSGMDSLSMQPSGKLPGKCRAWCVRHPCWTLTLLTVAALAPFLAKPFNVDDPCYLWAAKQILLHPANPYGFNVNWYGFSQPMWAVTQNPPLLSYYLALAATLTGWSEIGLHIACLLPAVAVVLGTCRLAKGFCQWPMFAAALTLFAPAFLVSSTTIMCDVPMLAFWIWTVVFWTEGLRQNNRGKLSAAGVFAALALLTKYNGVCLIPLLMAYGWFEKRRPGGWAAFLLIPLAALFIYEWTTFHLYGRGLFSAAAHYAKTAQASYGISNVLVVLNALTFTGGCFAAALFYAPFLWRKRMLSLFTVSAALPVTVVFAGGTMANTYQWLAGSGRVCAETQVFFWTVGGVCVLALALADVWQIRDAGSWLLALWVLGTFVFAAFFNWTVNARSILPMAPAVAILIARRLGQNRSSLPAGICFPLLVCAALSLLAAQADFQLASSTRKSAEQVCAKYAASPGRVWFEGHWGFQYYMQACGAWPLDFNRPTLASGDILIIPLNNSNAHPPGAEDATLLETFTLPVLPWFANLNMDVGAGFYSSLWGPLPFALGRTRPEKFAVYRLMRPSESAHSNLPVN